VNRIGDQHTRGWCISSFDLHFDANAEAETPRRLACIELLEIKSIHVQRVH
jgi:hypothetical protein